MGFKVFVHKKVADKLEDLEGKSRGRVKKALKELSVDPYKKRAGADIKKLSGTAGREDAHRIRVGDHRIVYSIQGKKVYATVLFKRGRDYREL